MSGSITTLRLGIIGGMGPAASNYFAELLTRSTLASRDQDHLSVLHFNNASVPDRTAYILGQGDDPVPELLSTIATLENAGTTHLCMPCNTAHAPQILGRLAPNMQAKFINMIDATMETIADSAEPGASVTVLGTEGTAKAGTYQQACANYGFEYVTLNASTQEMIMHIIYSIKKRGVARHDAEQLITIMRSVPTDIFVLGCTELSLLYEQLIDLDSSLPFVDSLRALAYSVLHTLTPHIAPTHSARRDDQTDFNREKSIDARTA